MASKYERIADDLRRRIEAGEYKPGQQLPTREIIGEMYKTSPGPVDEALTLLRGEGLVETVHGKGSFVRAPRHKVQRRPDRYQWEKDRALLPEAQRRQTGATEQDTGLEIGHLEFQADYAVEKADQRIADALAVPAGTKVLHRTYRTRATDEDAPISLIDSYLAHGTVASNPALLDVRNEPWPGGTAHQLSTVGIEIGQIIDRIGARPPHAGEAELLGIGPGVAVLVLRKTSIDTTGRVVEVSDVVMAGDRTEFVYTTDLAPWPAP